MRQFVLAVGQWRVVDETKANLDRAEAFLREASAAGASMCLLPEMFQTPYDTTILRERAETPDGPSLGRIRKLADELSMHIVAGSIPEQTGRQRVQQRLRIRSGRETLGVHRKIHLFDVFFEQLHVEESAVITPGQKPLVVRTPLCTLGRGHLLRCAISGNFPILRRKRRGTGSFAGGLLETHRGKRTGICL